MKRLEWNESFSVNVAELDQQHQKLFDLINLLYEAWQSDKDSDRDRHKKHKNSRKDWFNLRVQSVCHRQ